MMERIYRTYLKNVFLILSSIFLLSACGNEDSGLPTQEQAGIDPQGSAIVLVSIDITPAQVDIAKGLTQAFSATANYSDGTSENITSDVVWESNAPDVVSVDNAGVAKGLVEGEAKIAASYKDIRSNEAAVTVTPSILMRTQLSPGAASIAKGTERAFLLVAIFSDGSNQDVSMQANWTSTNTSVASINDMGVASGIAEGTTKISAEYQGVMSNTANLTITSAIASSVQVNPGRATIAKGTEQAFMAVALFSDGTSQDVSDQVSWQSSDAAVADINTRGVAQGMSVGTASISAQFQGLVSNNASLAVTAATVSSIQVTPGSVTLAKGTKRNFMAVAVFSDGSSQDISTQASWQSSNTSVASIDAKGVAQANSVGSANISAQFQGVTSNAATVTVNSASVTSIQVSPGSASIANGTTKAFMAVALYSDGSSQDVSSQVSWESTQIAVATIDSSGLSHGLSVGSTQIIAHFQEVNSNAASLTVTAATVASVQVTPASASLAKGTTQAFVAKAMFTDGSSQDVTAQATWTSSDLSVATISAAGVLQANNEGSSTIRARFNGMNSSAVNITVTAATIATVELSPSSATLAKGTSQTFMAMAMFTDGSSQDVSTQVTWKSSNLAVATISGAGKAQALTLGSTVINARFQGIDSNSVNLMVTEAVISSIDVTPSAATIAKGEMQNFTATAMFSDGSSQDITAQVTWKSSQLAIASISAAGLAQGLNEGSAEITANFQSVTSSPVTLTVNPADVTSVTVTPGTASLAKGGSQAFSAMATLSDGSTVDVSTQVVWLSSDPSVASINGSGLAKALNVGTVSINAQYQGVASEPATLSITAATVSSLQVSPGSVSIANSTSKAFMAIAVFSDGTSQDVSGSAAWVSSNDVVATVDAAGVAQAASVGTAVISAQYQGVDSNNANLTVTAATVMNLQVSPGSANLAKGTSQAFMAQALFSDGSSQDVTGQVTWTSSAPAVASIDATGIAQALDVGSANISATLQGVSSNPVNVSVSGAVVSSVQVSPGSASVAMGTSQDFMAVAVFSDGSSQDVSTQATWSSSNDSIASVNSSGWAQGLAVGSADITAQFQGVTSNTANLTVTPATVITLQVSPVNANLAKGTLQAFVATALFSDGSSQNVTSLVSWQSSDSTVVSISAAGVAQALEEGSANVKASFLGVDSNTVSVTVSAATVTSVQITPSTASIAKGTNQAFMATATFSDASTQDVTSQVTWQSDTVSVASINSNGVAQGVGMGTSNILARLQGVDSNVVLLTVTAATITDLQVTPISASIAKGTTQGFTAQATFSDGGVQDVTGIVTWESSDLNIVSINGSGIALGVNEGSVNINARFQGLNSNVASLTVTAAVLTRLRVQSQNYGLIVVLLSSNITTVEAVGYYSDGSSEVLPDSEVVFASSDSSLVEADVSGTLNLKASVVSHVGISAEKDAMTSENFIDIDCLVNIPLVSSICTIESKEF